MQQWLRNLKHQALRIQNAMGKGLLHQQTCAQWLVQPWPWLCFIIDLSTLELKQQCMR
jgi:hypothetical protein